MPAPIVAAAALAARLAARKLAKDTAKKSATKLTMRQKAGKAVVNATTGKTAARKYAESKMRENAKPKLPSGKAKPLAEPKSAVRVKPPKKTVGNPPNLVKAQSKMIRSVVRSGGVSGRYKKRDVRVLNSKKPTGKSK